MEASRQPSTLLLRAYLDDVSAGSCCRAAAAPAGAARLSQPGAACWAAAGAAALWRRPPDAAMPAPHDCGRLRLLPDAELPAAALAVAAEGVEAAVRWRLARGSGGCSCRSRRASPARWYRTAGSVHEPGRAQ